MTKRLDRLAVDADPGEDVRAAVLARHERAGARLSFVLIAFVTILFGGAGWPLGLGGVIGSAISGAVYYLLCDNYVLVICGHQIRVHRRPGIWRRGVPLGAFDRAVGSDSLRAGRRGVFNDTWWIDGVKMLVEKDLSKHLADLLERRSNTLRERNAHRSLRSFTR